jgi:hypothetical protein
MSSYPSGGYGYICPNCGIHVPSGVYHICPTNRPASQFVMPIEPILVRIATALEKIVELLESDHTGEKRQ